MTTDKTILLVEDDPAISLIIRETLGDECALFAAVGSIAERNAWLADHRPDLIITDVVLPDGDGIDSLPGAGVAPETPVIVLSAQNTLDTAVRAQGIGSYDYLPKPFDLEELTASVRAALARGRQPLAKVDAAETDSHGLIGRAPAMQAVYRTIARLASNDLAVLILGESGTGKEVVARAIHATGLRRNGPFVAINMAAIPRELIEAELFGHEKGAFTGAHSRSAGRFEQASGGTLFLDEVGDIPLPLQVKLLRFLQERTIERIGGRKPIAVDTRIVCATHRDLDAMIAQGAFRDDLYYRFAEMVVKIPALAERPGDAVLLARHFLHKYAPEMNPAVRGFAPDALQAIDAARWPGNVRELENRIKRAVIMADGKLVTKDDLDMAGRGDEPGESHLNLRSAREAADRVAIRRAMTQSEGNISLASKLLGISRPTLYDLLKQYRIQA